MHAEHIDLAERGTPVIYLADRRRLGRILRDQGVINENLHVESEGTPRHLVADAAKAQQQ